MLKAFKKGQKVKYAGCQESYIHTPEHGEIGEILDNNAIDDNKMKSMYFPSTGRNVWRVSDVELVI